MIPVQSVPIRADPNPSNTIVTNNSLKLVLILLGFVRVLKAQ